jgi:hypothetical protein
MSPYPLLSWYSSLPLQTGTVMRLEGEPVSLRVEGQNGERAGRNQGTGELLKAPLEGVAK